MKASAADAAEAFRVPDGERAEAEKTLDSGHPKRLNRTLSGPAALAASSGPFSPAALAQDPLMINKASAGTSSGPSSSGTSQRPVRVWALALAATVATVATVVERRQEIPDPYRPATLAQRFLLPSQRNAFAGGLVVDGDLHAVYALPGTDKVWAAGDGGLLLRSDDGGVTWEKGTFVDPNARLSGGVSDSVYSGARGSGPVYPATPGRESPLPNAPAQVDSAAGPQAMLAIPAGAARLALAWMAPAPLQAQEGEQRQEGSKGGGAASDSIYPQSGPAQSAPPVQQQSRAPSSRDSSARTTVIGRPMGADVLARVSFRDLYFRDTANGWAVGGGANLPVFVATRDGGRTWAPVDTLAFDLMTDSVGSGRSDEPVAPERLARILARAFAPYYDDVSYSRATVRWHISRSGVLWSSGTSLEKLGSRYFTEPRLAGGSTIVDVFGRTLALNDSNGVGRIIEASGGGLRLSQALPPLASLFFLDSRSGWATTLDGRVLFTTDGGESWTVPETSAGVPLRDVVVLPDGRGWAVGDNGTILRILGSEAGWRRNLRSGFNTLRAILRSPDSGPVWQRVSGGGDRLVGVSFSDGRHGWAVGTGGVILATSNAGRTWKPQRSGVARTLHAVKAISPRTAVAVGDAGTMIRTADGGRTWGPVRLDSAAVQLVSYAGHAIVDDATDPTALIATDPTFSSSSLPTLRGMADELADSLARRGVSSRPSLRIVEFPTPTHGFAFGDGGYALATTDGGVRWDTLQRVTRQGVVSASFTSARSGTLFTREGRFYGTEDGGRTWRRVLTGGDAFGWPERALDSTATNPLVFASRDTGWTANRDGAVLGTRDGGATWTPEARDTLGRGLHALAAVDGRVWAVGKGGAVLRNVGNGWETVRPGPRRAAPWYLLSWVLVLGLVRTGLKSPPPPVREDAVEGLFVSDRPLRPGDPDPLALNKLALAVSRFLRNERTDPPLTLAITGKWGTGKSSLMNLVRGDLERWGFRPVWFNAWHHQTEEHLLAALLENVRAHAIPPVYTPAGLRFRLRLLLIRTRKWRPVAVVAFLALFLYAGYLLGDPGRVTRVWAAVGGAAEGSGWKALVEALFPDLAGGASSIAVLVGFLTVAATLGRSMKAFGVNPASLMATVSNTARIRDLQAQTSFRHRFAREFEDVTEALKPWDLVVFVDDLDRCRSKHVLDALEGINFLCSSGRCVIIMGMDTERVVRCVGLELKEEADALLPAEEAAHADASEVSDDSKNPGEEKNGQTGEAAVSGRRNEFARQYLEKLVNIEVPVPRASRERSGDLLVPPHPAPEGGRVRRAVRLAEPYAPAALWTGLAAAALFAGLLLFRPAPETPSLAGAPPAADSTRAIPLPDTAAVATTADTSATVASAFTGDAPEARGYPGKVLPAPQLVRSHGSLLFGVLGTAALALLLLITRPDPLVRDSPRFKRALKAWAPFVAQYRTTPRAMKKYLNRVRYYAMRQRVQEPSPSRPRQVWDRLRGRREVPQSIPGAIPDEVLVALAALHECVPDRLKDDATFTDFRAFAYRALGLKPGQENDPLQPVEYDAAIPLDYRARFHDLAADVRVS